MHSKSSTVNELILKYKKTLFLNNHLLRLNTFVFLLVSLFCSAEIFSAHNMGQPSNLIFVALIIPLLNVFLMFYLSSIKSELITRKCTHPFLFRLYLDQQFLAFIISLLSFPLLYWAFYTPQETWIIVIFTFSAFPNLIVLIISSIVEAITYNNKKKLKNETFMDK